MTIKTLKGIDLKIIYTAFDKAFADYEVNSMPFDEVMQMITRRGFNPEISFGAFENDELVSFTLNGLGNWKGKKTAYDTGTGTIKEFRGKGLAKRIFQESVPVLKENGITQYLLEVLQHNDKAVNLYKNQAFKISREFDYFTANKSDLKFSNEKLNNDFDIKEINIPDYNLASSFWDFQPSWQNTFDSIEQTHQNFKITGAFKDNELIGYGITEINTGDITQLAVSKSHRRKGVGTVLLHGLIDIIQGESIKIINTEKDKPSIKSFLESINIQPAGSQYEMIKLL
ncbi:MAG: GNAT family N-acetyltransferase [Bacteroidales bacterium]|nr:GNAT family N-acetyltransferase [Bacteroidales bacterium]